MPQLACDLSEKHESMEEMHRFLNVIITQALFSMVLTKVLCKLFPIHRGEKWRKTFREILCSPRDKTQTKPQIVCFLLWNCESY